MASRCSVCSHPQRTRIDAHLVGAGQPKLTHRQIAASFSLSKAAVGRHALDHVNQLLTAAADQVQLAGGAQILVELAGLYQRTMRLLDRAEAEGDLRTALAGVREARGTIETLAKVVAVGGIEDPAGVNEGQGDSLGAEIQAQLEARSVRTSEVLVDEGVAEGVIEEQA